MDTPLLLLVALAGAVGLYLARGALLPRLLRRPVPPSQLTAQGEIPTGADLATEIAHHFLSGFNAMIESGDPGRVEADAAARHPHLRPFFVEGASGAWLPRGWIDPTFTLDRFYREWVEPRGPGGSGAWLGVGIFYAVRGARGFRALARALPSAPDPFWNVRAWDGAGFKVAFMDLARRPLAWRLFEHVPAPHRPLFWQGLGRGVLFEELRRPGALAARLEQLPPEARAPVTLGFGFALAFTHLHHLDVWLARLDEAPSPGLTQELAVGGVMALHFRRAWDEAWLQRCVERLPPERARWILGASLLGGECLPGAPDLLSWQDRLRARVQLSGLPAAAPPPSPAV